MKLKTLAWIQIIIGIFFLIDGLWISSGRIFTQLGANATSIGLGLLAFLTGYYNLKQNSPKPKKKK